MTDRRLPYVTRMSAYMSRDERVPGIERNRHFGLFTYQMKPKRSAFALKRYPGHSGSPMNKILVVCTANLVRSPFTAAILVRATEGKWEVDSAGLAAVDGEKVPLPVLQDVRRYVVELSKHRARRLTMDDVRASTVILGMTEAHRDALQTMLPSATPRIFTVPEFVRLAEATPPLSEFDGQLRRFVEAAHQHRPKVEASPVPEDVADPLGESSARTRECIDHLADLVDRLAVRLV